MSNSQAVKLSSNYALLLWLWCITRIYIMLSLVHSYWSRLCSDWLDLDYIVLLSQLSYALKTQLKAPKAARGFGTKYPYYY